MAGLVAKPRDTHQAHNDGRSRTSENCPRLPTADVFAPFNADHCAPAGVRLGTTYPYPTVDHAKASATALAGYGAVKAKVG